MKQKNKYYEINMCLKYTHTIRVKATKAPEAKEKAFQKLIKRLKKKDFETDCECYENG